MTDAERAATAIAGPPITGACYLAELTVCDFAIIERLQVRLEPGLNVLTGETGAGKSILIDALGAALGEKFDAGWIRAGAERGSVEAIFFAGDRSPIDASAAPGKPPAELLEALAEVGCDVDDGAIILTRDISAGRSVSRINGRAVPIAAVARMGDLLVDVHSQPAHLSLSRGKEQRDLLDRFGRLGALRMDMARAARTLTSLRRELRALEDDVRRGLREAELLRHEVAEIEAAQPVEGEDEQLLARRTRLRNALKLRGTAERAYAAIQGDGEGEGALALVGELDVRLHEMRSLDPTLAANLSLPAELVDALEDIGRMLRSYMEDLDEDSSGLEEVESRIYLLTELKRRFGKTLDDVIAYGAAAAERLDGLEHHEERAAELRRQERASELVAAEAAAVLSSARVNAARALEAAAAQELGVLGMGGATFAVEASFEPDPNGLARLDAPDDEAGIGEQSRVAFDESGVDRVTFTMSANQGEPLRPVAQVASGGELARLMLALKSAMVGADETPVLVFDELEQGVGGRMGHVIGEKLWLLSRRHQVLCVTHLPQVAAFADTHFVVAKAAQRGRVTTQVERLSEGERVVELTAMLGGQAAGPSARQSALELLEQASAWKRASTI